MPFSVHVLSIPAHGHYMTTKGIALGLAQAGHNVTWILCDRSRGDYDADGMAARGIAFISAGPCPVYDAREGVLARAVHEGAGLAMESELSPDGAGLGGASRAMLDGMTQLAEEMCEHAMAYYAADPEGRLPHAIVFDADSYCGMDLSVVWRVPRIARVGTGPRDPYSTPSYVPAYLSGAAASAGRGSSLAFRWRNAVDLAVSRLGVAWWLLPRIYSKHRRRWLRELGGAGVRAAVARGSAADGTQVGIACDPQCLNASPASGADPPSPCTCVDETWMDGTLPWDGVPTLYNTHWGFEYARPLRPFEHAIGHTNAFELDARVPLPAGLATWLNASDTAVVYVGLGTLSVLPAGWMAALAEAMLASRSFRFVWSIAAAQQGLLPASVQLSSARALCATEPVKSAAARSACAAAEALVAAEPGLLRPYRQLHDIPSGVSNAGTVLLVPWAPQVALLSHPAVSVFVTHGGMNGIAEGTYAQTPMLCMPLFSDQPDNCARVEDRGLGVHLPWPRLAASHAAAAAAGGRRDGRPASVLDGYLQRLHGQPGFRRSLQAAWLANAAAGGVPRAVALVEAAAAQPYGAHLGLIPADYWAPWYEAPGWEVGALVGCALLALAAVLRCPRKSGAHAKTE